jgi:hypothetical protein
VVLWLLSRPLGRASAPSLVGVLNNATLGVFVGLGEIAMLSNMMLSNIWHG